MMKSLLITQIDDIDDNRSSQLHYLIKKCMMSKMK